MRYHFTDVSKFRQSVYFDTTRETVNGFLGKQKKTNQNFKQFYVLSVMCKGE